MCQPAFAVWYEGQSQVTLNGADIEDVRVMAIKNAIADAAYKNGSIITAEDILLDGLLVSSKAQIRTQGRIQRVEILDETLNDDVLTVTVKVDITSLFECAADNISRSVLITQFQLLKPKQASYGGIFEIGRHISKRFENQLRQQQNSPDVLLINNSFAPIQSYNEFNSAQAIDKSIYLAKQYNRQYVVFGYVRDISLFEQVKEALINDEVSLRRNFTVEVFVLDVFLREIVFEQAYHSEGDWPFELEYTVDLNNSLFWRNDYGRVVLNTINSAVLDISNTMQCARSFTQILSHRGDSVRIGIGSRHGIKKGDKFAIYKATTDNVNSPDLAPFIQRQDKSVLTVTDVNPHSAQLSTASPAVISLTDIYDLLSPITAVQDEFQPSLD
jgi:hypothetical protein